MEWESATMGNGVCQQGVRGNLRREILRTAYKSPYPCEFISRAIDSYCPVILEKIRQLCAGDVMAEPSEKGWRVPVAAIVVLGVIVGLAAVAVPLAIRLAGL